MICTTHGKLSHCKCRHLVAFDTSLLLSIANIKLEHRALGGRVQKLKKKDCIYNTLFDKCCSLLATSHCVVSSLLDGPEPEQGTSFSPECQRIIAVSFTPAQTIIWTL